MRIRITDLAIRHPRIVTAAMLLTAGGLFALALLPTFPYGSTLPVSLTQDWGIAQDLAAIAALVALRFPAVRLPAPNTVSVLFLAFLAYGFLSPEWARHW